MSKLRVPARPGLSYLDSNAGCLVTEGPDVGRFKARIRELDPGVLDCYYDFVQKEWVVTQKVKDGTVEEFLLADRDLSRAFERVQRSRNDRPGALTGDQMDDKLLKEQTQEQEREMGKFREIAGDAAERLIHALKKDGIHDHENIFGPKPRRHLSRRDVRIRGS